MIISSTLQKMFAHNFITKENSEFVTRLKMALQSLGNNIFTDGSAEGVVMEYTPYSLIWSKMCSRYRIFSQIWAIRQNILEYIPKHSKLFRSVV